MARNDSNRQVQTIARQGERKLARKDKQVERALADRALARLMREINGKAGA